MPTVALISSAYALESTVDPDREIRPIADELGRRGIDVRILDWRAGDPVWNEIDLAIIKSPWDYAQHPADFRAWLSRAAAGTRVMNPPRLIEWNMDKRYLGELASEGVPVCASRYADDLDEVRAAIEETDAQRVVIKPTVSAGSADTGLFERHDVAAVDLAVSILAAGKTVLVQPEIASVSTVGERSLLHFGGEFSHAIRKGPLLAVGGGLLTGDVYEETITLDVAPEDERAVADAALAAARRLTGSDALYARVDIARAEDGPVLMELELLEPSYFMEHAPQAVVRYADHVEELLASLSRDRVTA